MIPYNSDNSRSSASPDRRYRMSQPTLNSSFSGFNFVGSKLSYNSLRTSGDVSINYQIKEDRLSTPNVHSYMEAVNFGRKLSGQYISPSKLFFGPTGKRDRLSQPTLVTGDYYPGRVHHQRLSYPCLNTWNERPTTLHSPIKQKRLGPSKVKVSQRDRLSALDFGSKYKPKESKVRDRFSIPELESQNELKLIAGTPKQRFSLDSQLNPDGTRARRLLPSPISEHQTKEDKTIAPSDGLEGVIIASATPLLPSSERQFLVPIFHSKPVTAPPPTPVVSRERMSVPEIRNSSLRRLLDPPSRQRHSISAFRQSLMSIEKSPEGLEVRPEAVVISEISEEKAEGNERNKSTSLEAPPIETDESAEVKPMPKHIQKHYSYTYNTKEEARRVIGKLMAGKPRKKYLESNFDENEQVITTVIETEIPMILSSPKYMKKTHVYSSDPPKWMKKCLEGEKKMEETLRINQRNKASPGKKTSPGATSPGKKKRRDSKEERDVKENPQVKDTTIRVKSSRNLGENKYEVAVSSNISETDICRLYGIECDSDSEDSTSV
ncbi:uncharacterized protein LOC107039754 [Diachasma alloeum]|uniref:uncharacterized protein LOC107039754 n=1 Tax=Diachasma alloeum TaxID=454923 RepID=UPI00073822E0|nr:uncharacterized protein LOC107039754 [Diachasma alloeum]